MNQLQTTGIVLTRTDYGEADRIVSLLTPEYGKIRLMARGVRKVKSKLAGGIELFSVSDISFINGKGEIGTLVSCRLKNHYGNIVQDLSRVQLGYDMIKQLNRSTEDETDAGHFELLNMSFAALDDNSVSLLLIRLWFQAQLLSHMGHLPNLLNDVVGEPLTATSLYDFDFDSATFRTNQKGKFDAADIKALRLMFSQNSPLQLMHIDGLIERLDKIEPIIRYHAATYLRT